MRLKAYKKIRVLGLILCLMMAFTVSAQAASWSQKFIRFSGIAGETLALGDVVCILGTTGKIWKADADSSTLRPAVGVIGRGGSALATVEIVSVGILTGQTTASPGARLFLSASPGAFTTSGPANAQALGWVMPGTSGANGSTKYFISVNVPTSAGAAY